MPSPLRFLQQLLSLFRYWQRHPLARRDLSGTVARFLRWQFGSRLLGMPVVFPWVGNTFLVIESGMTGATMNVYCGLHEAADMAFVLHVLRPGDLFLDVGANVGSYSILASGVAGAHTIALEPIPATFDRLSRNIRLNDLRSSVDARCLAVGASEGSVRFTASRDTTNRVVSLLPSSTNEPTVEVPLTTLDQLLQATNTGSPLLWKVDVEGYEPEVLSGAMAALHDPGLRAVLLEADTPGLQSTMEEAGFARYSYDLFSRQLKPSSVDGDKGHNQLWIRDLAFVQDRCRTAPSFQVGRFNL
jgi:FkbM family methyltransferase